MNLSPATRRYIYRVAVAVVPLLVFYGWVDDQAAPLIIAALGSIFTSGLAAANVNDTE